MPSQVSSSQIASAVVRAVNNGAFPETDDVLLADVTTDSIPSVRQALLEAEKELEAEVRSLAASSNIDIDSWLVQAKQLQHDINASASEADDILALSEKEKAARAKVADVSVKVDLLRAELEFNELLDDSLVKIQHVVDTIAQAKQKLIDGALAGAVQLLEQVFESIGQLPPAGSTIRSVLLETAQALRKDIVQQGEQVWSNCFKVDKTQQMISLSSAVEGKPGLDTLEDVFSLFELSKKAELVSAAFAQIFVTPLLSTQQLSGRVEVKGSSVQLIKAVTTSLDDFFANLTTMLRFLQEQFPLFISTATSELLIKHLNGRLIDSWLPQRVPTSLEEAEAFQNLLSLARSYDEQINELGWKSSPALAEWAGQAPKNWLAKKRETALHLVREALPTGLKTTSTVKKTERRTVQSAGDEMEDVMHALSQEQSQTESGPAEEEDVSGWGFDDEEAHESVESSAKSNGTAKIGKDNDEAEAWGWDEDHEADPAAEQESKPAESKPVPSQSQEIVLEETLTVTGVPAGLMDIIKGSLDDADMLSNPEMSHLAIATSARGLYTLPTLIFAMYRASAQFYYSENPSGNMYLYNDCSTLVDQLVEIAEQRDDVVKAMSYKPAGVVNLDKDIETMKAFGQRAYVQEMSVQKTILRDFLDGAQGFQRCATQPYSRECETAVGSCIDRIRRIHHQWSGILSASVLLQATGSLLASVINKIIVDVQDKSQISEPESQKLCDFCGQFNQLDELFISPGSSLEDSTPQTAVFTRGWLKFQYLVNILESSLVDIRYLWTEGELSLEFTAEEVIDLIEALFEDSDHRRKAIAEIKRTPPKDG